MVCTGKTPVGTPNNKLWVFYPQMERYQIQSAVKQLDLTTMHGCPAQHDERFYGDMIKDGSAYLFFSPLFLYALDKSYVCLRYYLSNKCRGCRDTHRLDCFQIKVPTVGPKGCIWKTNWICVDPEGICRFMVQFPENQHDTSCYTNIIYQCFFFLFTLVDLWSFGAMYNMFVS